MKKVACGFLVSLTLVGLMAMLTPAWGQEVTASIVGTVTDSSGAPIKGAVVRATDADHGTVWTGETNEAGAYNLLRLPIGNYGVKVTAPGFQTAVYPPFALVLNQTARVDVQLKVGKISETVEVTGAAPLLQTETTDISTPIDHVVTENVPLLTRNYGELALLTAGAVSTNPGAFISGQNTFQVGRPYINGNREQTSNYILDGIDNNQHDNNEVAYTPNPDAIQELNVITQNPSAEFGNFLGGIMNVSIKSGTNSYHGSAFDFWRNDKLNANSWANGLTTPVTRKEAFHWNQFGATFGGPIIKNRLFFFVDYEGLRNPTNSPQTAQVMSAAERTGNFGELCTDASGTFNTSGVCSVASAQLYVPSTTVAAGSATAVPYNNLTAAAPLGAGLTLSTAAMNIVNSTLYPTAPGNFLFYNQTELNSADQGDVKIDWTPNDKDRIFGRYSQQSVRNPTTETFLLADNGFTNFIYPLHNGVADWTHPISNSFMNDLRVGFSYFPVSQSYANPVSENLPQTFGIPGSPEPFLPSIQGNFGGVTNLGNALSAANVFADTVIQISDSVLKTHGNHEFHAGFQFNRYYDNFLYPGNEGLAGFFNFNGQYTAAAGTTGGSGLADFMLGLPNNYGIGAGVGNRHMRSNLWSVFGQDNWRVRSNVTLNLGLRWELFTPRYAADNNEVNYSLYGGQLLTPGNSGGLGNALYNQYNGITNFEPRIGIAWQPQFLKETVVRAAFGVSNFMESNGVNNLLTQNPPFETAHNQTYFDTTPLSQTTTLDQGFTGFPGGCTLALAQAYSPICFAGVNIHAFDVNLRPEVHYQWNFSLQRQFGNSTTLQIGYVGQENQHLSNITMLQQGILNPNGSVSSSPYLNPTLVGTFSCQPGGLPPCTRNPGLVGQARYTTSNGVSNYNALQIVLQERLTHGLQALVNYTWSKCLSDTPGFYGQYGDNVATESQTIAGWAFPQNPYDQLGDYGRCPQNVASNFNGYFVYELPFGHGKQFGSGMNAVEDAVLGGWRLSSGFIFHSGFAQTIFANTDTSGTGGFSTRADCVPGVSPHIPMTFDPSDDGVHFLNPAAVTTPAAGTFGNCQVGAFDGPGYRDMDLGIGKDFRITEGRAIEFRMDATNVFNIPIFNFGQEYSGQHTAGASNYGEIFTSQGSRQIQLGIRYHF
jgi:Carboxypeptidase regulatory-like domain/TonB dependent receptor